MKPTLLASTRRSSSTARRPHRSEEDPYVARRCPVRNGVFELLDAAAATARRCCSSCMRFASSCRSRSPSPKARPAGRLCRIRCSITKDVEHRLAEWEASLRGLPGNDRRIAFFSELYGSRPIRLQCMSASERFACRRALVLGDIRR